jgi:cell division protein FtsB
MATKKKARRLIPKIRLVPMWLPTGTWWKRYWPASVIAILVIAIICLSIFLPRQKVEVLVEVPADTTVLEAEKTALGAENIALKADKAALSAENSALKAEKIALGAGNDALSAENTALKAENAALRASNDALSAENAVLGADNANLPQLVDGMKYRRAEDVTKVLRLVFPNVAKGSVERPSYGIPSERDLLNFLTFIEGLNRPANRVDFLNWLGGQTELWSQDAANGVVDPSASSETDSFAVFLFYDEQEEIRVMGYDPTGAKGGGYYWKISSMPEVHMHLGLY